MKKILMVMMLMGLIVGISYAGGAQDANFQLVIDSQAVAGTATIYSDPVLVGPYSDLSYLFTVHADTVTTDVKLEVQMIDSNISAPALIVGTTNQLNDPNYDVNYSTNNYDSQWTDLATDGTLVSSLTSGKTADGFDMPVCRWMRFAITGNASNEPTSGRVVVSLMIGRYSERQ